MLYLVTMVAIVALVMVVVSVIAGALAVGRCQGSGGSSEVVNTIM